MINLKIHDLKNDISYFISFKDANDMNYFLSKFNPNSIDIVFMDIIGDDN